MGWGVFWKSSNTANLGETGRGPLPRYLGTLWYKHCDQTGTIFSLVTDLSFRLAQGPWANCLPSYYMGLVSRQQTMALRKRKLYQEFLSSTYTPLR